MVTWVQMARSILASILESSFSSSILAILVAMSSGLTFCVGWVTVETVVWEFAEAGVGLAFFALILSDKVEYSSGFRTAMLDFLCQAFWKGRLRGRG